MPVNKVVLVNPNRWKPKTAPLAIEYLGDSLESQGFAVDILDLCNDMQLKQVISDFFKKRAADLVGITHRNLDDIHYGRSMAPEIHDVVRFIKDATDAPIVLGGSGFSIHPERMLEYCGLDLGIVGEGEVSMALLMRNLGDVSAYPTIPGLVYRTENGFRRNPVSSVDLSTICISKRSQLNYTRYPAPKGRMIGTAVQTKRGCPRDCIYCVIPQIEGRAIRLRPPGDIVDEIENLVRIGINRFWFADSEFNYPISHANAICEEIIQRKLNDKIFWSVYLSPTPFSYDLAKLMYEAGCIRANFSIENANEKMLQIMRKDFTPQDILYATKCCHEAKLVPNFSLMVGGPGETLDTVLETLDLMKKVVPNEKVTFGEVPGLRIYPNTPLADMVKEEGFDKRNPNLQGCIEGNDDFFRPVYYMSSRIGIMGTVFSGWRRVGLARQVIGAKLLRSKR